MEHLSALLALYQRQLAMPTGFLYHVVLGKMVIIIGHDDRYFHIAERMIRLEYGRNSAVRAQLISLG